MGRGSGTTMLRWSTAAMVLAGYGALAAVPQIGPTILLPPLLAIACSRVAEYAHEHYPSYAVVTRGLTIAYLCFIPLTILSFGVLDAVILLVCFIQFYTLLHSKSTRSYYHLHLMSLFLLLAACVQSPDPAIAIIMLVFLVSAVWANLSLRLATEEDSVSELATPEIVGLDNLDHQAIHGKMGVTRNKAPIAAFGLSVAMVAMTALFFLFTPRIEAGLFGRSQDVVETTGLSESVDLTGGSTITQDNTPVMMVRFPDEPDGQVSDLNWLYWRVSTLSRYQNNSWRTHKGNLFNPGINHRGPAVIEPSEDAISPEGALRRTPLSKAKSVHQVIYMDQIPPNGVPAMHLVQSVNVLDNDRNKRLRWGSDGDLAVLLDKADSVRRLNYEVWSEPEQPSPAALRAAPPFSGDINSYFISDFLEHGLSEQSVALAERITANLDTPYDKAMAIQGYLSGSDFLYSLNIPDMGRIAVIDTFINRTKMGHCELFATAMALMLRTQGVPTRVVSGFRGGEWRESDQTYTIRANMAHLWVEAWFPGEGWVIFDPSPQLSNAPGSGMERIALFVSRVGLKARMFWFQEIVGFDRASQIRRLREASTGFVREFTGGRENESEALRGRAWGGNLLGPMLLLMLVAMGAGLAFRRRTPANVRAFALNADQLQAVKLYLALRRRLIKYGVDCRGKTAEEIRDLLSEERWGAPPSALGVLACYNTVRFGGAALRPGEVAELRRGIRELQPRDGK